MTWFTQLTGIDEISPQEVHRQLSVDGERLVSLTRARVTQVLELACLAREPNWIKQRTAGNRVL
jgi:hypothetical protein